MFPLLKFCLVSWAILQSCHGFSIEEFKNAREDLIEEEKLMAFGSKLILQGDEIKANDCLMAAKNKEVEYGFKNPTKFLPAKNFLDAKVEIEKSEVFKIIHKMPKGSVFHAHSTAMVSLDYVVKNLTHQPNLYASIKDNEITFRFFNKTVTDITWESVDSLRRKSLLTDYVLTQTFLSLTEKASEAHNIDEVWASFEKIFDAISGLIKYRPIFEQYFYHALEELYEDNVMYIEIRGSAPKLYESDGTVHDPISSIGIMKAVIDRFTTEHPNFVGAKLIYSFTRGASNETFDKHVDIFRKAKKMFPTFIAGFDLIGQEDKGHTLVHFAERLLALRNETQFFFHAGETNWYGHEADENLVDSVLLNTKRIGHGYALLKHPKLMEMVKARNITIELNPISNQVLKLVKDMRNHPAAYFFAENFPIVVSNDDPTFWGAKGLSYDFYEAFVGIMSRHADLRALKQLAINSIVYSSMNDEEQKRAFVIWEKAWKKFTKYLAYEHKCVA